MYTKAAFNNVYGCGRVGADVINHGRLDQHQTWKISSTETIIRGENIDCTCYSNSYGFYYTKEFAITKLSLNI